MRRCVALALLLLAPAARGDEETALYFVGRAREALEAEDLDGAEKWIGRALEEMEGYAPALLAAADVAVQRGRRPDAIRHLEACLKRGDDPGRSAEERQAIREARKRLEELDPARFEYDAMIRDYVSKVRALAERKEKSDPELARECWRNILLVRPGHAEARRHVGGPAKPRPPGTPIFNGKDLGEWTGSKPAWSVRDGHLFGSVADAANINRFKREVKGDFSLVCEMRVVKDIGNDPLFGLVFGLRGSYDHFGLWVFEDAWRLEHQTGEKERDELHRRAFRNFDGEYDRFSWNTYRIDVEGKRITGYVNGKKIWSTSGAIRPLDGFVGCWVQEQTVEIRSVVLAQ